MNAYATPAEIATTSAIAITPAMYDGGLVYRTMFTDFGVLSCAALNRLVRELTLNGETLAIVELDP